MDAIELNQEALDRVPGDVSVPRYNRHEITPGILHIGVGHFHRAHRATYLNRLFGESSDHDWGIIGAGVRPKDVKTRELLRQQDWLSTIIQLDPTGYRATVCGAMIDYLPIDPKTIVDALSRAEIRIVSLTVTEGGYYIDANTGGLDADHPDIVRDMENPNDPRTVYGILLAGLAARRERETPPFTVVSCDNLPDNGRVTRQAMVGLAAGISADEADWVASNVAFPNTMVDCITPATGEREHALALSEFGIEDASPAIREPFRQWVLEDRFTTGRPALEKVGVEFVTDVAPCELMKLRILNGGHATIAYPGALLGHHFAHDAMGDPLIRAFREKLERDEIIPTLPPISGVDFHAYLASVMERFTNPKIGNTIPRLCLDGSNRQPKLILPTLADRLKAGQGIDGLALVVALWCRYCAGTRDDGSPLAVEDESAERLGENARRAEHDPMAFLSMTDIFGPVGGNATFAAAFSQALKALYRDGIAKTLETYAKGGLSDSV